MLSSLINQKKSIFLSKLIKLQSFSDLNNSSTWTQDSSNFRVINNDVQISASADSDIKFLDVLEAYRRIGDTVKKSPLDYSSGLSELTNCSMYIKKEHIGICGAYKERGALNKILQLNQEQRDKGVICASAGNHAQAVSYHSTRLGVKGLVVMPQTTPFVKVAATKRFGADVLLFGQSFDEATQKAAEISKTKGMTFVHAFNDKAVVCGQGSVGLEIMEQNPYLDAVVIPIGGGGLIAGMSLAIKTLNPKIKVYGVEARAVPGMYKSVLSGKVTKVVKTKTMADGIAVETIGDIPFDLARKFIDEIVLVEEDEIANAVLTLLEVEKTVVEPSGAAALAAIMSNKLPQLKGKQVAIVATGGNIDMTLMGRIIEKGLVKDGRIARIQVTVEDVPGQIAK